MAFPDTWSELALVAIQAAGGSVVQYAAAFFSFDFDQGDKDEEIIPGINGGRITKSIPEAPSILTLEGHFVELDTTSSSGIHQLFHTTRANWDTSEPLAIVNSRNRDRFRIAILFTNDAAASDATGSTAASTDSFRVYVDNAKFISIKDTFGEGILTTTVKFKIPPFDDDGTGNINLQSGDNTALSALASFT